MGGIGALSGIGMSGVGSSPQLLTGLHYANNYVESADTQHNQSILRIEALFMV